MLIRLPDLLLHDDDGLACRALRLRIAWPDTALAADTRLLDAIESLLSSGYIEGAENRLDSLLVTLARRCESALRSGFTSIHACLPERRPDGEIVYPALDPHMSFSVMELVFVHLVRWLGTKTAQPLALPNLEAAIAALEDRVNRYLPKDFTLGLLECARLRGIPVQRVSPHFTCHVLGIGRYQRLMHRTLSNHTRHLATMMATNKSVAHDVLAARGFPVPRHVATLTLDAARHAAQAIGYPVVVKPQTTDFGLAVSTDIRSDAELAKAFAAARPHGAVLVEQHVRGDDHRFSVIDGKVLSVGRRLAAHIVGDGQATVRTLIDRARAARKLDPINKSYAFPDEADPLVTATLNRQGLKATSIPAPGQHVALRNNANVSTGGTMEYVTARAHPDNLRLAERAAAALGLDIAGVDVILEDVTKSWRDTSGAICEVNPSPGLEYDQDPDAVLDYLTHDAPDDLRVPVILVIGTAETARPVIETLLDAAGTQGLRVSHACGTQAFLDAAPISHDTLDPEDAVRVALYTHEADLVVVRADPGLLAGIIVDLVRVDAALVCTPRDDTPAEVNLHAMLDRISTHIHVTPTLARALDALHTVVKKRGYRLSSRAGLG